MIRPLGSDLLRLVRLKEVVEREPNGINLVIGKHHAFDDVSLRIPFKFDDVAERIVSGVHSGVIRRTTQIVGNDRSEAEALSRTRRVEPQAPPPQGPINRPPRIIE